MLGLVGYPLGERFIDLSLNVVLMMLGLVLFVVLPHVSEILVNALLLHINLGLDLVVALFLLSVHFFDL